MSFAKSTARVFSLSESYGRVLGVGRGLGVGLGLGVCTGVEVGVGVGVGIAPDWAQYLPPLLK